MRKMSPLKNNSPIIVASTVLSKRLRQDTVIVASKFRASHSPVILENFVLDKIKNNIILFLIECF